MSLLALAQILTVMCFNLSGLILTQEVSSVFRAFWDVSSNFIVIIASFLLGFEKFHLVSFIVKIIGLILLILGTFIFSELFEVKYMGFNEQLRKYSSLRLSNSLMYSSFYDSSDEMKKDDLEIKVNL